MHPLSDNDPLRGQPDAPAVFHARGLGKTYHTGAVDVRALHDVDLDIVRGEFIVLLGASGSGKSTLLNILGGLDVPTTGEVWFADHRLTGASEAALTEYRREHVGFVFQFYNLIPSLTVRENVALVTDIASNPMPIDEAVAMVGLAPRQHHFPAQLSGGEQQRVAIARGLASDPRILFADEPTGSLDMATGDSIMQLLRELNGEGLTIVMVTHNPDYAALAGRCVQMREGRVLPDGTPA